MLYIWTAWIILATNMRNLALRLLRRVAEASGVVHPQRASHPFSIANIITQQQHHLTRSELS